MTLLDDRQSTEQPPVQVDTDDEVRLGEAAALAEGRPPTADIDALADDEAVEEAPEINPYMASAAAFLATAGVGWMLGGIFTGFSGRLVGLLGALIGTGLIAASYKVKSTTVVQVLALPIGIIAAILLVAPATGGGANPVSLVKEAIQAGGLSQPPVPFDPGWRFLLLVLTCAIGITAATAAVTFNRAKLAALFPAPVIAAGVLLQPPHGELLSVAGALLLAVASLAVAYGSELARESVTGASFEVRRLGRAGAILGLIVGLVMGLSQLGFLYPPTHQSNVIPPKRPQTPPAVNANQLLFTATMKTPEPLRTGELDVYLGDSWLTPPYDPERLVPLKGENLPGFTPDRINGKPTPQATPSSTVSVRITINNVGEQRQVPDVANPVRVDGGPRGLQYDPRTQTLQTAGRPGHGDSYTITAAAPATAAQLAAAPKAGPEFAQFLQAPPPPNQVRTLFANIPPGLDTYDQLQFIRNYYYKHAVGAGPGNPVPVTSARVGQILTGSPASPYELTAGEVLLARWLHVPARIGYGYYDEAPTKSGVYEIYPTDGRMWLEAYFPGSGWVPILGQPAQARSSLDQAKKKKNPEILPNGQIAAQLYIPIYQRGVQLLYTLVRYWLLHAVLPIALPILFFWLVLPGLVKMARRMRRSRWAHQLGHDGRIATAYAEVRDLAIDLNVGHPTLTPLEFLDVTSPDDEHTQLAWLVSRALWGDLGRDLREEDAETAERLSRSMRRRLLASQPAFLRVASFASRVSLRDPFSTEIPNLWWSLHLRRRLQAASSFVRRHISPRQWWRAVRRLRPQPVATSLLVIVVAIVLGGCAQGPDLSVHKKGTAPLPTVPGTVQGVQFVNQDFATAQFANYRSIALINDVALYAVKYQGVTVGTLQTAAFKPGLRSRNKTVREGVIKTLGGSPSLEIVDGQQIYGTTVNGIRLLVHFLPGDQTYELLAADKDLPNPDTFFAATILTQVGGKAATASLTGAPPFDPRRGLP